MPVAPSAAVEDGLFKYYSMLELQGTFVRDSLTLVSSILWNRQPPRLY